MRNEIGLALLEEAVKVMGPQKDGPITFYCDGKDIKIRVADRTLRLKVWYDPEADAPMFVVHTLRYKGSARLHEHQLVRLVHLWDGMERES